MSDYTARTRCRLCDSHKLDVSLDLGETPLANELGGTETFPLVVLRCEDCEHHQLSIAVSPARLWGPSYPYQSGTSPVMRQHLRLLADEIAELAPGGNVLELASNDGTLVKLLRARGIRSAMGMDPSGPDDEENGLFQMSWPEPYPRADEDVIVALNVFAHVDDLHGFTAAIKKSLKPNGVFIFEVGYVRDVVERGLFDVIYHEHMSYHSLHPLRVFFDHHGLRLTKFVRNDSQGGSIRCYVRHHDGTPLTVDPEPVLDMSKMRETIDVRSAALQSIITSTRGTFAGYGAPAKLTTMMYATGLREYCDLQCVFDDNPLKVGRTTPGAHVPIVSSAELLERAPDNLVLFSWNFADAITARLRAFGYKGNIINPMSPH